MTNKSPSKKMSPWTTDASGITIESEDDKPYSPTALKEYHANKIGSLKRVLVAPKGYGKTFHLKYKSFLVRNNQGRGIAIHPEKGLDIEYLKLTSDSKEMHADVARLTVEAWSMLWQFVLIAKGLQLVNAVPSDDSYLQSLLRSESIPVGDLLTEAIRDRSNLLDKLPVRLQHVRRCFNEARQDAIIFVENADEMFVGLDRAEQHAQLQQTMDADAKSGSEAKRTRAEQQLQRQETPDADGKLSPEQQRNLDTDSSNMVARAQPSMWAVSQCGLLLAIREIERSAPRLSVYTTLRAEAVHAVVHGDLIAATSYTVEIKYHEEDLQEIFAWHVDRMDRERLVETNGAHPAYSLMGSEPLQHRYVRIDGIPAEEDPFFLVLRHTTFSPRELVEIGRAIEQLPVRERSGAKRSERIRRAVDTAVTGLVNYFRANAIPAWDPAWEKRLKTVPKAVLDSETLSNCLGEVAPKFYAYGLLGIAEPTEVNDVFRQIFLTQWDAAYAAKFLPLPDSPYYFLHPWLHDTVRTINPKFEKNMTTIVGNGCLYRAPGPLRLRVEADANGHPALFFDDGTFDSPVSMKTGVLTKPAAFFFCYLFGCRSLGKRQLQKAEIALGRALFVKKFKRYSSVEPVDPFDDEYQRTHLDVHMMNAFPKLKVKLTNIKASFKHRNLAGREAFVEADFIDLSALKVDFAPGSVAEE